MGPERETRTTATGTMVCPPLIAGDATWERSSFYGPSSRVFARASW